MSTGVVLLEQDGEQQEWAHYSYSKANDYYKIRKRSTKGWNEERIQPEEFKALASISREELLKITWPSGDLKGADLKVDDESYALWSDFLSSLDRLLGCAPPHRKVPSDGELRKAYKNLKNDRPPYSVTWIQEAWESSLEKMNPYDNTAEGWVDEDTKRKALPPVPNHLRDIKKTDQFTSWLVSEGKLSHGDLAYDYVDREINPFRTTEATNEDGSTADGSGGGGIDLLLSNAKGEPVVGEVKVKSDSDSQYALIQALAYASELATTNQMRRLRKWYPRAFGSINVLESRVGILLIFVNHSPDKTREDTLALIREINELEIDRLGSIVAIENGDDSWKIMT